MKSVNEEVLKVVDLTVIVLRDLDNKNELELVMKGICILMQKQVEKVESLITQEKFIRENERYLAFTLLTNDFMKGWIKNG